MKNEEKNHYETSRERIAERLKKTMEMRGVNAREIHIMTGYDDSGAGGVAESAISNILHCRHTMQYETAQRISAVLHTTPEYLLCLSDFMNVIIDDEAARAARVGISENSRKLFFDSITSSGGQIVDNKTDRRIARYDEISESKKYRIEKANNDFSIITGIALMEVIKTYTKTVSALAAAMIEE